ncbi:MAG: MltA domain-containing protein [Desulfovibrionaceae bacterium]
MPPPGPSGPPGPAAQGPTLEDKARFFRFHDDGSRQESRLIDLRTQGLVSWLELQAPLQYSLNYVQRMPQGRRADTSGNIPLTWGQIARSLRKMLEILPSLDRRPELLAQHFTWFELEPQPIMSGYYTPEIEASLTRRPGYDVPIYAMPKDLVVDHTRKKTGMRYYRVENGKALPYYTRREIDAGVLEGRGLEIAWAKRPYDVFDLQVEGSGRIRLPDGTVRTLVYASKNGRRFKGMGAILRDRGLLPPNRLTLPHIRAYCEAHPEASRELMRENEAFIFFKFGEEGATGSIGRSLTPMVSLATDPKLLPLGSMVVMNTDIPALDGDGRHHVRGLGLAQDAGAAIKGSRLDYYVGEGHEAGHVGSRIWNKARIYLLVSREVMGDERAANE